MTVLPSKTPKYQVVESDLISIRFKPNQLECYQVYCLSKQKLLITTIPSDCLLGDL